MKVRIDIDGRDVEAEAGRDLLTTCLEQGVDVPHFCWHGALGSVGACRLCAVRVFDGVDDTEGRIEMSCMTPVKDGQRVEVDDPDAARFRARVIEWLMLNHPHDCAVCEEGGACHLQDMTIATGLHTRRSRGDKRVYRNQDLGPLLTHEMNRCIACYRCTRFYRDYAGGQDLHVFGAHDRVYFGRAEDGVLESPFAGNLSEICPTGVFCDKGWSRAYARRWDMSATPSICAHCSVGCNLTVFERHGTVRLVQNRYHGEINGFFICDRGRYGPKFVESDQRIATARWKGADIDPEAAMAQARAAIEKGAVGIGSPRASLEANFALSRLTGPSNFYAGVGDFETRLVRRMVEILGARPERIASLKDMERADAVLVLGEDVTGTAPRAALALRQASRGAAVALAAEKGVPHWLDAAVRVAGEARRSPFIIVAPSATGLDEVATRRVERAATEVGAFGEAVAAALRGADVSDGDAVATASVLAAAKAPLIVAGAGLGLAAPVEAAAAVMDALGAKARLALFPPEANSFGLAMLGTYGLDQALAELERSPRAVIILENDLFERSATGVVDKIFDVATQLIVLDCIETRTTGRADLVLPVASVLEAAGTFINCEGRAQRGFAARPCATPASWRVISQIGRGLFGAGEKPECLDDVLDALASESRVFSAAAHAAPRRSDGDGGFVARAPGRMSGRTASDLAGRVAEGHPRQDPDSLLTWSMEGAITPQNVQPALGVAPTAAVMHSVSAAYQAQEWIGGPLKGGDPGVKLFDVGPSREPVARVRDAEAGAMAGRLFAVPTHDPFEAGETERACALLAARRPEARIVLHPDDAARLRLAAGDVVRVTGALRAAPVTLDPRMVRGHVGVPTGWILPRGRGHWVDVTREVTP